MIMPCTKPSTLREILSAFPQYWPARCIYDGETKVTLGNGGTDGGVACNAGRYHGKTIRLATATQIETILALIDLDGVAGRILLVPSGVSEAEVAAACQEVPIDEVITHWGCSGGASAPHPQPKSDDRQNHPTQWLLFTSGTTGRPKIVIHDLESLSGHLVANRARPAPVTWCSFYDIRRYGGLQVLLRALYCGGSLVLCSPEEAVGSSLERAARAHATHFLGTPSHWRRVLMHDGAGNIAPDYVRLSGETAGQAVLDRLRNAYPVARIVHAFASTEGGLAFEVDDGLAGIPARLVDKPGELAELKIRDGSLLVRSPRAAYGYASLGAPRLVEPDGFIDTGDLLCRIGDRYHFTGRRDGTVNVGGRKVQPEEVEAVINDHPAVEICVVRSRPNPITGAIVVADIVPRRQAVMGNGPEQDNAMRQSIQNYCRQRLPPHKVPASIGFVSSLDIGPSGKLARLRA